MAQHDYNIANQTGLEFRADLNNALQAIVTGNSGPTEPSTTFPGMKWIDTSTSPPVEKRRNQSNNAWETTLTEAGRVVAGAANAAAQRTAMGAQATLVSGNNIKTINGESVLGAGNIVVAGAPAGCIAHFAMYSAPTGWLKANGALVSRTTYAELFSAIGTTYGAGDGSSTFNVPDLRGEFLRGLDDGRSVDAGRTLGSAQADNFKSHSHALVLASSAGATYNGASGSPSAGWGSTITTNVPQGSAGGTETRPRNVAMLACIKY